MKKKKMTWEEKRQAKLHGSLKRIFKNVKDLQESNFRIIGVPNVTEEDDYLSYFGFEKSEKLPVEAVGKIKNEYRLNKLKEKSYVLVETGYGRRGVIDYNKVTFNEIKSFKNKISEWYKNESKDYNEVFDNTQRETIMWSALEENKWASPLGKDYVEESKYFKIPELGGLSGVAMHILRSEYIDKSTSYHARQFMWFYNKLSEEDKEAIIKHYNNPKLSKVKQTIEIFWRNLYLSNDTFTQMADMALANLHDFVMSEYRKRISEDNDKTKHKNRSRA